MRDLSNMQNGSLYVVGSANGVSEIPSSVITVDNDGTAYYKEIYSFMGPGGQIIMTEYAGTYGNLQPAGKRKGRRGIF